MDNDQFYNNHPNEYYNNFLKFLTGKFMGCFGTTKHMGIFNIKYEFDNNYIHIKLNPDGYVRFNFSSHLKETIIKSINEITDFLPEGSSLKSGHELFSVFETFRSIEIIKTQIKKLVMDIFKDSMEIIYIPAGRSLLASMSEQLYSFSITNMDLTMQEFINLISLTKRKFGTTIPEMVLYYTKTVKGRINNTVIDSAYELIKQILKADYISDSDGEKIYYDDNHWIKLMYGSSGQQEVLWILMIAFSVILENKRAFIIIEEPEAHLFPIAQKEIINLISLLMNTTGSQIIITTHSPYILTSLNLLLYSGKVENSEKIESEPIIIPKSFRLAKEKLTSYVIRNNKNKFVLQSLIDTDSGLIDTDYIDKVSEITNEELEKLIDMEIKYDL